jgi:general secretion pathway protein F
MATFDYLALDASGRQKRGVVSADGARAARQMLLSQKLTLLELNEARSGNRVENGRASGASSIRLPSVRLSSRDRVVLTRQLAVLIQSSTPIDDALGIVAEQSPKAPVRRALMEVRDRVSEGARLSDAMAETPGMFDPLYRALVGAGEASGRLGHVMERLADHLETSQKMARKVQAALTYPALLTVVAGAVISLLMVFVVPRVVEQFDTLGQELPPLTQMVIAVSGFFQGYGLLMLASLIGLVLFVWFGRRTVGLRLAIDGFFLKVPGLGDALRAIDAARFCRTLSTLINAGTPAYEAMGAGVHVVSNEATRDRLKSAARLVGEGTSVGTALSKTRSFPPMVVHMAAAGERVGALDVMLSRSADYLESDFEARSQTITSLMEPLIIVVMGGIVTVIVLAIMLPILRLNTMVMV